jgi:diacylglycerol kinase
VEAEGAAQANRIEAAIRQHPRLVVVVVVVVFFWGGCKYGFRCLVFGVLA